MCLDVLDGRDDATLGVQTSVSHLGSMTSHFRTTVRALVALVALPFLGACALVGYPAGDPGGGPAAVPVPTGAPDYRSDGPPSTPAPEGGAAPADVPEVMRSDAGRTYEVFGVTYQVVASADGFRERGFASWYGEAFHGRPTATGETYDMYRLSAAHRTLPLHTWVEVTNLDNGKRLVLRINDRGPFARTHERVIDLSWAAALELGVVGPGTAPVEIRALPADEVAEVLGRR
jgi:rare lipoprotein A